MKRPNFMNVERAPGKRQLKPTAVIFNADADDSEDDADFNFFDEKDDGSESSGNEEDVEMGDEIDDKESNTSAMDVDKDEDDDPADNDHPSPSSHPAKVEKSPPICCVCLKFDTADSKIFKCVCCNIYVHDFCYGITEENIIKDSKTGKFDSFLCEPCLFELNEPPHCELCPSRYGAFKKTDVGSNWVHVLCGQYLRNITYVCTQKFIGISYQEIDYKLFGKKICDGCNDVVVNRTGIVVGCEAGMCKLNYHTTCAQRLGLLVERETDGDEHGHLFCKRHSADEVVKHRKKMYAKMVDQEENRMIHIKRVTIGQEYYAQKEKQLDTWRRIIEEDEYENILYPGPKTPKRIRMFHSSAEFMDGFALKSEMAFAIDRESFGKEMTKIPTENFNPGEVFSFTTDSTKHFDYREEVLLPDVQTRAEELKVTKDDLLEKLETEKQELEELEKITDSVKADAKESADLCSEFIDCLKSLGAKNIKDDFLPKNTLEESKPTTSNIVVVQKQKPKASTNSKIKARQEKGKKKGGKSSGKTSLESGFYSSNDNPHSRKRSHSASMTQENEKICFKCKKESDPHQMLLCDTCKCYFHITCLEPPLTTMPKKSPYYTFQCSDCFEKALAAQKNVVVEGRRKLKRKKGSI